MDQDETVELTPINPSGKLCMFYVWYPLKGVQSVGVEMERGYMYHRSLKYLGRGSISRRGANAVG
jgi:hypothetical protein